jgi:hypothetical protein
VTVAHAVDKEAEESAREDTIEDRATATAKKAMTIVIVGEAAVATAARGRAAEKAETRIPIAGAAARGRAAEKAETRTPIAGAAARG